jgi:hypothetical protein
MALPSSPMQVPSFRDGIRWASNVKTPAKEFPARSANMFAEFGRGLQRDNVAKFRMVHKRFAVRCGFMVCVGGAVGRLPENGWLACCRNQQASLR